MKHGRRSLAFWGSLLVGVVLMPATTLAVKQLYHAVLTDSGGTGKGSATIVVNPGYSYMAKTYALPDYVVTEAWLAGPSGGGWEMPLCVNGGPVEDDCTYLDGSDPEEPPLGNLNIEGAITPSMLISAGITGAIFSTDLRNGNLSMVLYGAGSVELASGNFIRQQ